MTGGNDDVIGQLLQEVFRYRGDMKRFLETVVNQAMQGTVVRIHGKDIYPYDT